jgi:HEAT repeat protein
VRRRAAEALGEIGDERALPELERVAKKDKDSDVRMAAREAMERIRQRMRSG